MPSCLTISPPTTPYLPLSTQSNARQNTSLDQPTPGLPQSHVAAFAAEPAVPWPMTISETESDRPADGISYALPDYTPRPHSNLGVGLNNYEPAWLPGHGFNMNDVNFSIFSAISDFGQRNFAQPPPPDHDQVYAAADALSVLNASPTLATARGRQEHQQQQNQPQQSASIVQHKWHTQLSSSLPVHMPSAPLSDPEQVGDEYRRRALPSTAASC